VLLRSTAAAQEYPLLMFNHTLVVGTSGSESVISAGVPCFPAIGFGMPATVPTSLDGWWCNSSTEYAFVGFSYEITQCQSKSQLNSEFADIRKRFKGRYIRLYGVCDRANYYDDIIEAAWDNGLGVHALIWFGWDDPNIWKTRRDSLFKSLLSNPKAKFVTRVLQFGSEPLYDWALDPAQLAEQVMAAKTTLAGLKIPVTISEMAYGFQKHDGAADVLAAIDVIDAHILPFFASDASTGDQAWKNVQNDLDWFVQRVGGRKIWFSQNGWPSTTYPGVEPNSPDAVASVAEEFKYYALLDSKCSYFKTVPGGGVGWFAHIYSDYQEPGYGILDANMNLKFQFAPRTSC